MRNHKAAILNHDHDVQSNGATNNPCDGCFELRDGVLVYNTLEKNHRRGLDVFEITAIASCCTFAVLVGLLFCRWTRKRRAVKNEQGRAGGNVGERGVLVLGDIDWGEAESEENSRIM
mmetsp:Transcript_9460/g.13901  ORF Transcript_9460/g.13901 Transcript_9460/m.13901 type:complete len:118 (-) Transcript_9460:35-388(-)